MVACKDVDKCMKSTRHTFACKDIDRLRHIVAFKVQLAQALMYKGLFFRAGCAVLPTATNGRLRHNTNRTGLRSMMWTCKPMPVGKRTREKE